jgi:hypothetical protein
MLMDTGTLFGLFSIEHPLALSIKVVDPSCGTPTTSAVE